MTKTAFAFDVGNGYVKAKSDKREIIAPSSIAKKSSLGNSSLTGLLNYTSYDYSVFKAQLDDGEEYVWGKDIAQVVDPKDLIDTYTHNDRYNQKRFKLLCLFILAELASDYSDEELKDVLIVTGLPSQEIDSEEANNFKSFLEQTHVITRNGEQKVINITDVRMVEQPTGTLLNIYMNEAGQVHKDLLTQTITVVDFGTGTTILDTFKNMKRIPTKSRTYYEGINDLHREIATRLEIKHGIKNLSPSLVDQGFRRKDLTAIISERRKFPFDEIAKEVIIEFIDNTLSNIDTTLTNRDSIDSFVITGGGVNIIGDTFKDSFNEDSVVFVEDSQQSNLAGFYKLADNLTK